MFQMKEWDKTLVRKNKLSGDRKFTQEKVQSDDHKDDERIQEKNGSTE